MGYCSAPPGFWWGLQHRRAHSKVNTVSRGYAGIPRACLRALPQKALLGAQLAVVLNSMPKSVLLLRACTAAWRIPMSTAISTARTAATGMLMLLMLLVRACTAA